MAFDGGEDDLGGQEEGPGDRKVVRIANHQVVEVKVTRFQAVGTPRRGNVNLQGFQRESTRQPRGWAASRKLCKISKETQKKMAKKGLRRCGQEQLTAMPGP